MAIPDQPRSERDQLLRALLTARRRQLTGDLQLLKARMREHGSRTALAKEPDDRDPSDLDVVLVDIATETLRRVDQALERLEDGEYGVCARCRRPIAEARLRALPFAVCCHQCEAARERDVPAAHQPGSGRKRVWTEWHPTDA